MDRRPCCAFLDHALVLVRKLSTGCDLDRATLQRFGPVRWVFRSDDRPRIDVEVRRYFEAFKVHTRPGAIEGNRLGHTGTEAGKRGLDRFETVISRFYS